MKKLTCSFLLLVLAPPLFAQSATAANASWRPQTLIEACGNVLIFAVIGIIAAIVGFKIFDWCTPGHLEKEIIENKNVAAAIVAGAAILGVSIIIAACILG